MPHCALHLPFAACCLPLAARGWWWLAAVCALASTNSARVFLRAARGLDVAKRLRGHATIAATQWLARMLLLFQPLKPPGLRLAFVLIISSQLCRLPPDIAGFRESRFVRAFVPRELPSRRREGRSPLAGSSREPAATVGGDPAASGLPPACRALLRPEARCAWRKSDARGGGARCCGVPCLVGSSAQRPAHRRAMASCHGGAHGPP